MRQLLLIFILVYLTACKNSSVVISEDKDQLITTADIGLKDAFKNSFYIGTALNSGQIFERDTVDNFVIKKNFNAIVSENCMKAMFIHPQEDSYFWEESDAFVEYGIQNDMFITGHTLAWHSQTPDWLFIDQNGKEVSRDILIERMKSHITTVMQRYKGKVKGWDVVNEAILDDGSFRNSKYYEIIGEDWVELAFRFAQEADSEAELYYNDYNMASPLKREGVYKMIKDIQNKGVKVTGIGMQCHLNIDRPGVEEFEESIKRFSELGSVMITEMDISVLPWPGENISAEVSMSEAYQLQMDPFKEGLSESMEDSLNNKFFEFFELFQKYQEAITRVTLWGVNDKYSWKNNWPIRGRTDYPLLFNRDNSPKRAVNDIIELGMKYQQINQQK